MPISAGSFGQWLKYQRLLLRRARAEHRVYSRSVAALSTGAAVSILGAFSTYFAAKHMQVPGLSPLWLKAGGIGVLASFGLWWILSFVWFRLREPFTLDEERKADLEAERQTHNQQLVTAKAQYLTLERETSERHAVLEQQFKTIQAARPSLQPGILFERNEVLMVPIKNLGAPAAVWARLSVTGNTLNPRSNVYATWKGITTHEIQLGSGEMHEVVVAHRGDGRPDSGSIFAFFYWVPYIDNGEHSQTRATAPSWPTRPNPNARIHVKIEIYSRPESTAEPIVFSLTLVGCDRWENVQGVISAPFPQEEELQEAEPDPWNAFYVAAVSCIARFHALIEAKRNYTDDQDFLFFFIEVGETRLLALRLPEADSIEACRLLLPLLQSIPSDLNTGSPFIIELQSFLLRRQLGAAS